MRLTLDLVTKCRQVMNPLKERELEIRGYKIAMIENLGSTMDQYDTINLSENEIRKLDNFPLLKRLKTLIIANNFISRIAPDLANNVPNITSIVLTNNNITSLSEIDALSCFKALKHLVLLENGVVKQANYRLYVINRIPSLKVLDFKRIKDKPLTIKERHAAAKLYDGSGEAPSASNQDGDERAAKRLRSGLTPEQVKAIRAAIEKSTSLEDVAKLEGALRLGTVEEVEHLL